MWRSRSALCALRPGVAWAGQSASISTVFTPLRLGAPTTVSLGFQISAGAGQVPSPLTGVDFHYPANLGIATSGLGVASCPVAELEAHGPSICPPDSRMGSGSAFVEIPVGGEVLTETASIGLVAGPSENGFVKLLVSATGLSPVAARIVMPSLLLAGNLKLTVPLVESLPGAADVSVVRVHVTLGGNLTYYERRHGKMVPYRPKSVVLPKRCPRGGFKFSATFSFLDGTQAEAARTVALSEGAVATSPPATPEGCRRSPDRRQAAGPVSARARPTVLDAPARNGVDDGISSLTIRVGVCGRPRSCARHATPACLSPTKQSAQLILYTFVSVHPTSEDVCP